LVIFSLGFVPRLNQDLSPGLIRSGENIAFAHERSETWNFALRDVNGRSHSADEWKRSKAVVLFFIATECPVSNRYAPEVNRIVKAYSGKKVLFYAVHSDPELSAKEAQIHAADFSYQFTALLDPEQALASRIGVSQTPTAVILSPQGEALYRGRIDNRYLDFGQYRDTGIKQDLRIALDAVLAGKAVAEPVTKSIGCVLPPPAGKGKRVNHADKQQ
jgi:thiol-disulfide isomerase/thioredoxin